MEIRALDPKLDFPLFESAWEWQFSKSARWRYLFGIWEESREEFLAAANRGNQTDFGVFLQGELSAIIDRKSVV